MKTICTRTLLAVVAAGALATPVVAAPASAAPPSTQQASAITTSDAGSVQPDQDPFYRAPANISSYAPGQIVDSRAVTPKIGVLPVPVTSWQISYRSNDQLGRPILAVTTLMVPGTSWTKTTHRPVVSFQSAEDSVGTACAPSYTMVSGKGTGDAIDVAQIAPYLLKGWAIAIPDHEGPHAYFGTGINSGHITLDGIRAVKRFDHDGIGAHNEWGMTGYSGGAQATGWAAQLQPTYAPDVKLVGAAVGGMPADLTATARYIDGGMFSGFEFAVAESIGLAYPKAGIPALLNDRGRQDFQTIKGMCEMDTLSHFAFHKLAQDTTVSDPLDVPSVAKALKANRMGLTGAPQIPIYSYHADTDEIVPVKQANQTISLWRGKGTRVKVVRDLIGEHTEEAAVRLPSVVQFLQQRFDGDPFDGR